MAKSVSKGKAALESLFESGDLMDALEQYIRRCHASGDDKRGDKDARFPNPAGFCRSLGVGLRCFEALGARYPALYDNVMTLLEDEALNASRYPANSASLTTAFFKRRLGYASDEDAGRGSGEITAVFDHDIQEAGQ